MQKWQQVTKYFVLGMVIDVKTVKVDIITVVKNIVSAPVQKLKYVMNSCH